MEEPVSLQILKPTMLIGARKQWCFGFAGGLIQRGILANLARLASGAAAGGLSAAPLGRNWILKGIICHTT